MASEQEVADGRSERELGRSADLGVAHAGLRDPEVRQLATERQRAVETRTQADLDGGLNNRHLVDAGGLSPNTWERLERLSAAWEQAKPGIVSARPLVTEPEPGAVSNPTRRSRTPLTPEEVDAIRTARTNGESVLSIAKRFGVHRVTVWEQTKNS